MKREQRLREIRERVEKLIGNWWRRGTMKANEIWAHYPDGLAGPVIGERLLLRFNDRCEFEADAEFIAHARTDVPYLLALIAKYEGVLSRVCAENIWIAEEALKDDAE